MPGKANHVFTYTCECNCSRLWTDVYTKAAKDERRKGSLVPHAVSFRGDKKIAVDDKIDGGMEAKKENKTVKSV